MDVVLKTTVLVRGRFIDNPSISELRLMPLDARKGDRPVLIPFSDVSEISLRRWRPLRPFYPIAGFTVGTLAGGAIGAAFYSDRGYTFITPAAVFAVGGALAGFLVGVGYALRSPGMETVRCEPLGAHSP